MGSGENPPSRRHISAPTMAMLHVPLYWVAVRVYVLLRNNARSNAVLMIVTFEAPERIKLPQCICSRATSSILLATAVTNDTIETE